MEQALAEGYSAGVVDAHEHGDAAHDAGPLPLELVGLPEVAVDAGVQQANHSCKRRNTTCTSCCNMITPVSVHTSLAHKCLRKQRGAHHTTVSLMEKGQLLPAFSTLEKYKRYSF